MRTGTDGAKGDSTKKTDREERRFVRQETFPDETNRAVENARGPRTPRASNSGVPTNQSGSGSGANPNTGAYR